MVLQQMIIEVVMHRECNWSGSGGGSGADGDPRQGGYGGSGIVLIAYPT